MGAAKTHEPGKRQEMEYPFDDMTRLVAVAMRAYSAASKMEDPADQHEASMRAAVEAILASITGNDNSVPMIEAEVG
jgi:hypothetical protein